MRSAVNIAKVMKKVNLTHELYINPQGSEFAVAHFFREVADNSDFITVDISYDIHCEAFGEERLQ